MTDANRIVPSPALPLRVSLDQSDRSRNLLPIVTITIKWWVAGVQNAEEKCQGNVRHGDRSCASIWFAAAFFGKSDRSNARALAPEKLERPSH